MTVEPDLATAVKEAEILAIKHGGFYAIILDNWRGWYFIYDSPEVRLCNNDCANCKLYEAVSSSSENSQYAHFFEASELDKKMFGPHNFRNCKTLDGYKKSYEYFLVNETNSPEEIKDELDLLLGMRIVYAQEGSSSDLELSFKRSVIDSVLAQCEKAKSNIIREHLLSRNFSIS